jgi:hypothetical protein
MQIRIGTAGTNTAANTITFTSASALDHELHLITLAS